MHLLHLLMHWLKKYFDFYVFSNLHVSFAVFSLTKLTLVMYNIAENTLPLFTFFSTLLSYNFIRLYKLSDIQHWMNQFVRKYRKVLIFLMIISLGSCFYLLFQLQLKAILVLIPFTFFTFFYVLPINFSRRTPVTLRAISFIKLFLIAFSWAGVTVLFPLANYNKSIGLDELLIFAQRFLFVVAITLPFDIRDVDFDDDSLKTIPQVLGVNYAKRFGILCLMLFVGLEFIKSTTEVFGFREHLVIAVLVLIFLMRASKDQNKYYSAFLVESIPIVWLLLHLIIN